MRLVPYALTTAGILALTGSIGMGIVTTETIQTTGYAAIRGITDGMKAAMPAWLVEKGGLDEPVPLLTSGPVTTAILKATLSAKEVEFKARPQVEAIARLEGMATELGYLLSQYTTATTIGLQTLQATPTYRETLAFLNAAIQSTNRSRFTPFSAAYDFFGPSYETVLQWRRNNETTYKNAVEIRDLLQRGEPNALIAAFRGVWREEWDSLQAEFVNATMEGRTGINATVGPTGLILDVSMTALNADLDRIDTGIHGGHGVPGPLVGYLRNFFKVEWVIRPRHSAVLTALEAEKQLAAYNHYRALQLERGAKFARLMEALVATSRACMREATNPDCRAIGAVEPHLEEFLLNLGAWGFEYPEEILAIILRAQGRADEIVLTRRTLLRRLDIELLRRSWSPWAMMITVSVFLGITTFVVGFAANVAFILNMGLLGTVANLLGILHTKTLGLRWRAEMLETHKTDMLRLAHDAERKALQHSEALRLTASSQ